MGEGDGVKVGEGVEVGEGEAVVSGWLVPAVAVESSVGELPGVAKVGPAVGGR